MNLITVILLVVALVLFVLCTLGVPSALRFNLLAAGLAFCVLSALAGTIHAEEHVAQRSYDSRDQRGYDSIEARRKAWEHRRYCQEWRERVARHPRLRLPRQCWR